MRYDYYKLARTHSWCFAVLFFPILLEDAIERDSKRKIPVGKTVIERMHGRFERSSAAWDHEILQLDDIFKLQPVPPIIVKDEKEMEQSRIQSLKSLKHQVDLRLRWLLKILVVP